MKNKLMVVFILFWGTGPAFGVWPESRVDFSMLPPYCAARMAHKLDWVPESQYKLWENRLGPDFLHIHHYCAGLHTYQLALREMEKAERDAKLRGALTEMEYVRVRAKPGFVLLPEIYAKMSNIYFRLADYSSALQYAKTALRLKPDFTYPYAIMSDVYRAMGDGKRAVDVLKKGLEKKPYSKLLKRKLKKLEK